MRAAIVLLFVFTGLLAAAVIGLYARLHDPAADLVAAASTPTIRNQDDSPAGGRALGIDDPDRTREQMAELSARLDAIERELADLQQVSDRAPLVTMETPEVATEDKFREEHENTILAILADERDRVTSEAYAKQVRKMIAKFWWDHRLPEQNRVEAEDVFIEYGTRRREIYRRLAPGEKWPVAGDPLYPEWHNAWIQLNQWHETQLRRILDSAKTEELIQFMESNWGLFVEPPSTAQDRMLDAVR